MTSHRAPEVQQPCLATTYAYDTTIACGRPKGHGPKPRHSVTGYTWGDLPGNEGHCERPLTGDGDVYAPKAITSFETSSEVRHGR